jgi:GTP cyclohydrolase III
MHRGQLGVVLINIAEGYALAAAVCRGCCKTPQDVDRDAHNCKQRSTCDACVMNLFLLTLEFALDHPLCLREA